MRELILLRHAHAEPAVSGQADLDRPLSPVGLAEAEAAGKWLKENNLLPDCVLCSPSRRTRETLEGVMAAIGYVEKRLEDRIYEATPGTLAMLVDERRDLDRVLVVGHNPGLEQLVALMTDGTSSDYRGMPPGGVAVLGFPREASIEPGVASLNAFWWP
ncbi:histidine phosphatase family protein [Stenotrophomonas maltophilia]|uniref:SixA phosphatase family protein n=1 Tax=Stenotrophomonas maltophilia TaxID=40324 RepID=UPI001075F42B|nr:histidine phosphatase family protein [Stenotrophomonas maltophilia]TFZ47908.1 histidine phosphatase family protein [Stenotrophomonas maltophilia]